MYQFRDEYAKIVINYTNSGGNVMEENKEFTEEKAPIQPDTYESPELEPQRSNLQAMPVTPEFKGWRPNLGDNPIQPQQAQVPPASQPVQPDYYGQTSQPQYNQQSTPAYTQPQYNQQVPPAYTQPQYNQQPTSAYTQPQYNQQAASPYTQPVPPVQPAYSQPTPPVKEKGDSIGFGIASMVLGISSVLLFCTCFNVVTAILAVIFGIIQLVKNKNKVFAIVGISTAAVSIILTLIFWVAVGSDIGSSYDPYDSDYWYYRNYDLQDDIY